MHMVSLSLSLSLSSKNVISAMRAERESYEDIQFRSYVFVSGEILDDIPAELGKPWRFRGPSFVQHEEQEEAID